MNPQPYAGRWGLRPGRTPRCSPAGASPSGGAASTPLPADSQRPLGRGSCVSGPQGQDSFLLTPPSCSGPSPRANTEAGAGERAVPPWPGAGRSAKASCYIRPTAPRGASALPTPSSPPPARSPQMGDTSGCRALAWALLALLWVPKAGEWTLTHPLSRPPCRSPGASPAENGQAGPHPVCPGDAGSPGETRSLPRQTGASPGTPAAVKYPLEAGLQGAEDPAAGATSEPHPHPGCSALLSRLALGPHRPWHLVAGALILTVNKKDAATGLPGDTAGLLRSALSRPTCLTWSSGPGSGFGWWSLPEPLAQPPPPGSPCPAPEGGLW